MRIAPALLACVLAGCASVVKEVHHHPHQARLERVLAAVLPHTKDPARHYWVRVSEPTKLAVGLAVLPQRHLYLSEPLLTQVDDELLTALIAHGIAHHSLHHYGQRTAVSTIGGVGFKAGGFFVPGLSHGHHLGDPLLETVLSAGQEPAADSETVATLTRMGRAPDAWRRALELLAAQGYAERVGTITLREEDFTNRIERLR